MTTVTKIEARSSQSGRWLAAVVTFLLIFIILMVIGLLNAPTMGGPKVMASATTYLQEVQRTALPFLGAVAGNHSRFGLCPGGISGMAESQAPPEYDRRLSIPIPVSTHYADVHRGCHIVRVIYFVHEVRHLYTSPVDRPG